MIKQSFLILTMCITGLAEANEATLLGQLTEKINQQEFKKMTSVLVSKNKQLIYEQYFNEGSAEHKNDMRSASKSLTSVAIGFAIKDQHIKNVDQLIMPFFKDKKPIANPDQRKTQITIEDLLTMSSVLECDDWNSASRGNEERMYIIEDWTQFILNLPVRGIPPWKQTPENSPYGRSFSYCTGGVQVLTDLIERVTGKKLTSYLQEKLFNPLNISAPEFSHTPMGVTNGGGGMKMTSKDWIKLGELMLNHGQNNKVQILSKKWVDQSFKRRATIDAENNMDYGYLWWIRNYDVDGQTVTTYSAAGNGGNYMVMIPEYHAVVVITSTAYNTPYMHQQAQKILTEYIIPTLISQSIILD